MEDAPHAAEDVVVKPTKPRKAPKAKPFVPTGLIFLSEEDQKTLRKINQGIIKKLGLTANRSAKV